ncbi:receptor-like protein Cf-9 homolog isoform X1 [Coffea arabica]|uniref:Receptor-like protein Cf-9 homolog isoform X1 n=1 Tax=Coffea arabica TaxID=13443 RepID=A0A6P6TDI6_COFAR|nr:receptor-like protein 6 [Coffea arabica]
MKRQITVFSALLFFFLLHPQEAICFTFLGDHLCRHDDALALLQFKEMFSISTYASCDHSYPKTTRWKADTDCCNWDGVTCHNVTGRVIGLDLSCGQLQGVIHRNSTLFHLFHLRRLNLAFNDFTGSRISHRFGSLKGLTHLNLSYSNFQGEVVSEISHLSNLIALDLSANDLLRYEPSNFEAMLQNLTHLRELSLSYVNISSDLRVNFSSSLTYLDLSYTEITGNLPSNAFHLPNMQVLLLGGNENLTVSLSKLNCSISYSLKQLDLWRTSFSTALPNSIGCIGSLNSLNLGYSQISGVIPESIGNLTQLTELFLDGNYLLGKIPNKFSILQKISTLSLGHNLLSGKFPKSLLNLMHLDFLDLSSNQLTGEIGDFKNRLLSEIRLQNNQLTGSIPPSIFTIPTLSHLDLSANHFNGVGQDLFVDFNQLQKNPLQTEAPWHTTNNVSISYPDFAYLGLSSCQIKEFPEFLRNSESLVFLDLSNNTILGEIPSWFMSKTFDKLFYLNLSHNFLTSTIDQLPVASSMVYLDVSSNSLQGQIPSSICDSNNLGILDLSNNNLSDLIPQCLGNFSQNLDIMDLGNNRLFGTMPTTFSKGSSLRFLMLNDNQLQGPLPQSLAHCKDLELLDLGNNKIDDKFPIWLEILSNLEVLVLKSNQFHGTIGSCQTKSPFPRLRIIDASHNELTGSLPEDIISNFNAMKSSKHQQKELVQYMTGESFGVYYYIHSVGLFIKGAEYSLERVLIAQTVIDFSGNRFEGQIPEIIGFLHSLQTLTLSLNNFSGGIPRALGNLSMLESLDLSWNQLEGTIPRELVNLDFLGFLNLSENHLVGPIPRGRHFDTFGDDSYRGNLDLCGFPLTKDCGDTEAPPPATPWEAEEQYDDSEFFDGFTWKAVLLGYGCGLVLGLVMGGLIFLTGKPRWFVLIVEESFKPRRRPRKWIHIRT